MSAPDAKTDCAGRVSLCPFGLTSWIFGMLFLVSCLHAFVLVPGAVTTALQPEVGVTYQYDYVVTVRLTDTRPGASDITYEIVGPVEVTALWQNPSKPQENVALLEFKPQLRIRPKGSTTFVDHASPLDSIIHHQVVVVVDEGHITNFFAPSDQNEDVLNLQRGLASLFQLVENHNQVEETDASGKCTATYKLIGKQIQKKKHNCNFSEGKNFYSQANKVLEANLTSEVESIYEVHHDVIHSVKSQEQFKFRVRSLRDAGIVIQTTQKLSMSSQKAATLSLEGSTVQAIVDGVSKEYSTKLIPTSIVLSQTSKTCTSNCKTVLDSMKDLKDGLFPKKLATVKAASSFSRLAKRCRKATKQELDELLKATNNKKLQGAVLDAVVAAQTEASYESIFEFLPNIKDAVLLERTLLAIGLAPRPTLNAIRTMMQIVEENKLEPAKVRPTVVLGLGAMLKNLCSYSTVDCEDSVLVEAVIFLLENLQKCSNDICYVTYLRALRNSAHNLLVPAVIPIIEKGGKPALWGLEALTSIMPFNFTSSVRNVLLRVFRQSNQRYDSTSRLLAADLLLNSDPTEEEITEVVDSLRSFDETSTYLAARLKEVALKDKKLSSILSKLYTDAKLYGNYHFLSQPGISTAFTKLLADTSDGNSTYGLHLELGAGAILKQSAFDVHVNNEDDQLHLMRFGLYAGGLEAMMGSVTADANVEEATAGMELMVFGVALRPYVFFQGKSELMSHVWSGTASEMTPILQGNLMLHDHHQQVAAQCGCIFTMQTAGALSIDMSGALKVSVWNRNAHSEVTTKGAFLLQSSATTDASFIHSAVDMMVSSNASLSFVTDSEFYEAPFKMCTQMRQPEFPVRYTVRKVEYIPKTKHRLRKNRKVTSSVFGRSFDLHPKNSAQCHMMLSGR